MQKRAKTDIAMPPGRFSKAARETWTAWFAAGGVGETWLPHEVDAARRLIRVVDDLHRANDPARRQRLSTTVRTGERDLGLRAKRGKAAAADPYEYVRERARAERARNPSTTVAEMNAEFALHGYDLLFDDQ